MSYTKLLEYTFGDVIKRQRSISRLFPTFYDRVDKVEMNGGAKLRSYSKDTWTFDIASGTKDGVEYEAVMHFFNPQYWIMQLIEEEPQVWTGNKVDIAKLAKHFLDNVDIQWSCSCPANLYWGSKYTRSRPDIDANYGDDENRPPKIRNPKQYGIGCKHLQILWESIPVKYMETLEKWLLRYWGRLIKSEETKMLKGEEEIEQSRIPRR